MSTKLVSFLGLGIMGSAMAANLAKAGFRVKGWNRTPGKPAAAAAAEAGVVIETDIDKAIQSADVIFSCVGDEHDAELLLTGPVAQHAKRGALVVDTSTIGPQAARQINERLNEVGMRFLDAPVTGGDVGAKQGTLTILVGGDKDDFAECLPFFEAIGKRIVHCGACGAGQAMKLCNQILCAVNMVAVSEAFALADSMKVDKELLIDALSQGAGGSWALSNLGPRIARGDFAPGFTLGHMLKDLRLAKENSHGDNQLPGMNLAIDQFMSAQSIGGERQGTQAMFRVYQEGNVKV